MLRVLIFIIKTVPYYSFSIASINRYFLIILTIMTRYKVTKLFLCHLLEELLLHEPQIGIEQKEITEN